MAICNLFRSISNKAGTFFMFSEVSKQLTKALSNPQISIMPSKFVCLNLPDFKINTDITSVKTANTYLPELLQNYFENKIAFLPIANTEDKYKYIYSERDIERSFWSTINKIYPEDFKINFTKDTKNNVEYLAEVSNFITYIGDINIQNYQEYDNMGYAEIFMHIPAEARPIKNVLFNTNWVDGDSETSNKNITFDLTYDNGQLYSKENPKAPETILGYPDSLPYSDNQDSLTNIGIFDKPSSLSSDNNKDTYIRPDYLLGFNPDVDDYHYTGLRLIMDSNYLASNVETLNYNIDTEKNSIDFNAILVYFRIVSNNGTDLSTTDSIDIPYGIYITSDLETIINEETNTITGHFVQGVKKYINKYSTDDNIYTQQTGSGYALRLIARYLSVPNGTVYPVIEFTQDNSQDVSIYSELLSYMQKSQELMSNSTNELYNIKNTINEIYTGIQQNQFNVPQIFKKSNNYWWYINYKNTGHRANGLSAYEVYIDSLPEDQQKNPPTIQEWLDSLVLKGIYKQVLYSSKNMLDDTGIVGKTWGDLYPSLLYVDEDGNITDTYNPGLVELINEGNLIPGMYYEIVDYKTTQNLSLTNTKNIPYEKIIVQAANNNSITESGYYSDYPNWKINYTISNNNEEYAWALGDSSTIGRGTIYKLYNEKYNVSFPYDIFNIYFTNPENSDLFVKTFNYRNANGQITPYDEITKNFWNTDFNNIYFLQYKDSTTQFLNNYIFVYQQYISPDITSENNIFNNILFNGYSSKNNPEIIEYSELSNIKFNNIKDVSLDMVTLDGTCVYNLNINSLDLSDNKNINKIILRGDNIYDQHLILNNGKKFNPLNIKNIYKELFDAYYYNEDNSEIISRVLIKYMSGDGTIQILIPIIN